MVAPRPLLVAVTVALMTSGCFETETVATVPDKVLKDGWKETGRDDGSKWYGLAASWEVVKYQVSPPRTTLGSGPYAAALTLMTIDTVTRLDSAEVRDRLDQQIRDNAGSQDLRIEEGSRVEGQRTLQSGVKTLWFTYRAVVGASSSLFSPGHEARIVGEVGFDERSKITFVAVGLAQVQGSGPTGQYFMDPTNWARLVADPSGTIDGRTGSDGLAWNVRSH